MFRFFRKIRKNFISKKKIGNYLIYALGEVVLIVVGVLLALYLQNKNEENKTEQRIGTTISLIKKEILLNQKSIKNVVGYHQMLRDTLPKMKLPKKDNEIGKSLAFWKGTNTPRLINSAFQTGVQTGINSNLNPELLESLNQLYNLQESYNRFNENSAQVFFNADLTNVKGFKKTMSIISIVMSDLGFHERGLLKYFDKTLKKIDNQNALLK